MKIETLYDIGDEIIDKNGEKKEVIGVHIWVSDYKQTERYYLGNDTWLTIKRDACEGRIKK